MIETEMLETKMFETGGLEKGDLELQIVGVTECVSREMWELQGVGERSVIF